MKLLIAALILLAFLLFAGPPQDNASGAYNCSASASQEC